MEIIKRLRHTTAYSTANLDNSETTTENTN